MMKKEVAQGKRGSKSTITRENVRHGFETFTLGSYAHMAHGPSSANALRSVWWPHVVAWTFPRSMFCSSAMTRTGGGFRRGGGKVLMGLGVGGGVVGADVVGA